MKDKKICVFILFVIAIVVLLINTFGKKSDIVEDKIKIVTNYSNFYTVNSCLKRVGEYLSLKDRESVYLVTSDNYKKNNKVIKNNILDKYKSIDGSYTITATKMYYLKINENITKYYSKVEYRNNYDQSKLDDGYFIVYLDSYKGLFSIEPYDGEIFRDGANNE